MFKPFAFAAALLAFAGVIPDGAYTCEKKAVKAGKRTG